MNPGKIRDWPTGKKINPLPSCAHFLPFQTPAGQKHPFAPPGKSCQPDSRPFIDRSSGAGCRTRLSRIAASNPACFFLTVPMAYEKPPFYLPRLKTAIAQAHTESAILAECGKSREKPQPGNPHESAVRFAGKRPSLLPAENQHVVLLLPHALENRLFRSCHTGAA